MDDGGGSSFLYSFSSFSTSSSVPLLRAAGRRLNSDLLPISDTHAGCDPADEQHMRRGKPASRQASHGHPCRTAAARCIYPSCRQGSFFACQSCERNFLFSTSTNSDEDGLWDILQASSNQTKGEVGPFGGRLRCVPYSRRSGHGLDLVSCLSASRRADAISTAGCHPARS